MQTLLQIVTDLYNSYTDVENRPTLYTIDHIVSVHQNEYNDLLNDQSLTDEDRELIISESISINLDRQTF